MLEGTTELLSYALFLFLAYVYLPYTLFKFGAERSIDLGRRRDFTQLEEIIAGFVPAFFLHLLTTVIYWSSTILAGRIYVIDFAVIASMFGRDRGAVSDYLYVGTLFALLLYLGELWAVSAVNGWLFGRAVNWIVNNKEESIYGLDRTHEDKTAIYADKTQERLSRWLVPAWRFWYPFFKESIVPLYPWFARNPTVRVETTDHRVFYGRFLRYEKTTDGRLDAIRLSKVRRYRYEEQGGKSPRRRACDVKALPAAVVAEATEDDIAWETLLLKANAMYLKWSHVSDIIVMPPEDSEKSADERATLLRPKPRVPIKDTALATVDPGILDRPSASDSPPAQSTETTA